jgi:hypothetical protein
MSQSPIICFGQQPCGFFPKRFLFAKFQTARRLRDEIGGEIVFFLHDSDHDPRETKTLLRHRKNNEPLLLNFAVKNKIQRKFSPLNLKIIAADWQEKTAVQIPPFVDGRWVEAFRQTTASTVADFCLEMYQRMGLLEGIRVARSSDPAFRRAACPISDFFVDAPYEGEIVRARFMNGELRLHEGGNSYLTVPMIPFGPEQISPARDARLPWMQSVLRCTHYIAGMGEQAYLRKEDAPGVTFVCRETIDRSDEAYTDIPAKIPA